MIVGVASDHRGYKLKEEILKYLKTKKIVVKDFGAFSDESSDYPKYAFLLGEALRDRKIDLGIALCQSGVGMSMATSKVKGVRSARILSPDEARMAKLHNNLNILVLKNSPFKEVKSIIDIFLETEFSEEERHIRRLNMIEDYEGNHD